MTAIVSTKPSSDIVRRFTAVVLAQLIVERKSLEQLDAHAGRKPGYFFGKFRNQSDLTVTDLNQIGGFLEITPSHLYVSAGNLSSEQVDVLARDAFEATYPCVLGWCKNCIVEDEWGDGLVWNRHHGAEFEPVQVRQSEHLDLRTGEHEVSAEPAFELMDAELIGTDQAFEACTGFFRLAEQILVAQREARGNDLVGAL